MEHPVTDSQMAPRGDNTLGNWRAPLWEMPALNRSRQGTMGGRMAPRFPFPGVGSLQNPSLCPWAELVKTMMCQPCDYVTLHRRKDFHV